MGLTSLTFVIVRQRAIEHAAILESKGDLASAARLRAAVADADQALHEALHPWWEPWALATIGVLLLVIGIVTGMGLICLLNGPTLRDKHLAEQAAQEAAWDASQVNKVER